jgi:hypothetical protein
MLWLKPLIHRVVRTSLWPRPAGSSCVIFAEWGQETPGMSPGSLQWEYNESMGGKQKSRSAITVAKPSVIAAKPRPSWRSSFALKGVPGREAET